MGFGDRFAVTVEGTTLVAERWPAAGPPVVFLHSGVTDRRSWYAVTDALEGRVDAVCYDRRGYGDTAADAGQRSLDDLAAVVETLGGGPVVLVGNSMGGAIALDFSLAAADRVAALLLLAPAVSGSPTLEMADGATLVLADRIERAEADGDRDEWARLETWLWLDGPRQPEGRVEGMQRRLVQEMVRRTQDCDEAAGEPARDAWSRLEEIGMPAIVAAGEYDVPLLVDRSRTVAKRLPHGSFRLLAGTAHLPSIDQPDLVADLVVETLALTRR